MKDMHLQTHGASVPVMAAHPGLPSLAPLVSVMSRHDAMAACGAHVMVQTACAPFNLTLQLSPEDAIRLANNLYEAALAAERIGAGVAA